jgi:hypothetical protein
MDTTTKPSNRVLELGDPRSELALPLKSGEVTSSSRIVAVATRDEFNPG